MTPPPDQSTPPRVIKPFTREHAGLFRDFGALTPTKKSVIAFANQFGLLGPPIQREGVTGPFEILKLPGSYRVARPQLLPHHSWAAQITLMAKFLEFVDASLAVQRKTWSGLEPRINAVLTESCGPVFEWAGARQPQRPFGLAWAPRGLLGALWLQATLSVTADKEFRQCRECGRLLEISKEATTGGRTNLRFCSDVCRMRAYRRRTKARQLFQQGWTLRRIAKQLDTKTATVRGWVKKSPQ